MTKDIHLKCGFCGHIIESMKDFRKVRPGRKTILACPACDSILCGWYA